jgi:hypothetical protein
MRPRDRSNPSPPWADPIGQEALVDLLFQHYHLTEPKEPIEDPFLQQIGQHCNLKMPGLWAEQAKRRPPKLRLNILLDVAAIKRDCQPLLDRGADPDGLVQVVFAVRSDPFWLFAATLLQSVSADNSVKTSMEIRKLTYMRRELKGWTNSPIFPELPPDTQACIRQTPTDAETQHKRLSIPLRDLRHRAETEDPLLPWLERRQSTGRRWGQPS